MNAVLPFTRRAVLHAVRDVETLIESVLLPVVLMLMFVYVFGGALAGRSEAYLDFVVPAVVLVCAGFGAATTAVSVARDMNEGMMDRFRTMDVPRWAPMLGHVLSSVLRNLVATAVVIAVAMLLGYRPGAGPLDWLGLLAAVTMWVLAITSVFAAIGVAARSVEAASGYGFALLFLPYASSAFVPIETMPTWLQGFARHQPMTPVVDTMRAFLGGESPGSSAGVMTVWCAAITLLGLAGAGWAFARRQPRI
ncbi:ABC transporter permease [Demequina mangrovi]|uniref:Transport permease protein n=1 Tax=Demequina mangrovi TaxID=1043493 RepID=A0A1H6ZVE5_9MICO|nr:ABC transporter permease [Demequina mangrovi]SEJ57453.1 ABC-2 type transport system permease protein [Demequina mangrovi]